MKVLQFTIPVPYDKSVIAEKVCQACHYPYLHRHKEIQLTWIQKGEGTLIVGNSTHQYVAGDIFLIGANMPHVFKSNTEYANSNAENEVKALTIFFNSEGKLTNIFNLPEMKDCGAFIQQHQEGFRVPAYVADDISQAMINLDNTGGVDQLIAFFELMLALSAIKTKPDPLCTYGNVSSITDNEGIRIGGIYNYIMQHYNEDLTLDDVARVAFMTSESFCRYFKKHTGHTFINFLNEVRINEACRKLTEHRFESINTVAYKCGFKSITNFNRVFKIVVGTSPKSYIENYHNNNVLTLGRVAS